MLWLKKLIFPNFYLSSRFLVMSQVSFRLNLYRHKPLTDFAIVRKFSKNFFFF